jgi:PAS domain-containing protein
LRTAYAAQDWADSPLGPSEGWPASLRNLLVTALRTPAPSAVLWGDSGIAFYNDRYAEIMGARHPGAMGRSILDSVPDFAELNREALRKGPAGEVLSLREAELSLGGAYGTKPAWFHIDYLPVFGEGGEPAGELASFPDVTARVTAERRSREGDVQLRVLADNLPGAVVCHLGTSRDLARRNYTYVSAGVGRVLGMLEEDTPSDPLLWVSRVEPADQSLLHDAERTAAQDLSILDVEVGSRHPDGRLLVGRIISQPRLLPDGWLLWDGLYLDVTGRRAAEAELCRTAALLAAIGDATPDLIYAMDRESRFFYVNSAFEAMIGLPADRLVGVEVTEWAMVRRSRRPSAATTSGSWRNAAPSSSRKPSPEGTASRGCSGPSRRPCSTRPEW